MNRVAWDDSKRLFGLSQLGLVARTGAYSYQLTDLGRRYLDGEVSTIEVVRTRLPARVKFAYWLSEKLQLALDRSEAEDNGRGTKYSTADLQFDRAFIESFHQALWRTIYFLLFITVLGTINAVFFPPLNVSLYAVLFIGCGTFLTLASALRGRIETIASAGNLGGGTTRGK